MTYYKKQKKHSRTIYLNTDDAYYVDTERKNFNFRIPPINIEDESLLSVKNTLLDYRTSGLSVKDVDLGYISTIGISSGYNAPPNIIFTPQDGKGTGATAIGILQPVGLSTSATTTTTALGVVSGGSGYAGLASEYITTITDTQGSGASILPTINTATYIQPTAITASPAGAGVALIGTTDRAIWFPYYGTGATGDYSFTTTEDLLCDVLVVAGGGGGGAKYGGGGGAGALYYVQNIVLPAGNYITRTGKGGVPVALTDNAGSGAGAGNPSSISFNGTNIIFMRGGAGGASGGSFTFGAFGGSGSGGAGPAGQGQLAGTGTNIPAGSYGNKGGNAFQIAGLANTICGGGGGGAGGNAGNAVAETGTSVRAGAGGAGLVINTAGTSSTYGGGGGGGATSGGGIAGAAGSGGGGAGGITGVGGNGTNNLGGGGGGGGWNGTTAFAGGSGGNGYVVIKYTRNITANGEITSAVLTAGSGYVNLPVVNPAPPPPSEPATFAPIVYTASTGVITASLSVLNQTTNGFYNISTFRGNFVNNPVVAQGFCSTNASGTLTNIIISNSDNNGFYSSSSPITILSINGVLLGSGGVGLTFTTTYTDGRATSIIITNGGSGYGNNLVDAPVVFSLPATPIPATYIRKVISEGRLQAVGFGTGGSGYYKPTFAITAGLVAPTPALFNPIYLQPSGLRGVRMLTNGRGYTKPPLVGIDPTNRIVSNGDMPLTAEMTQTHLVEPNNVYTIKAGGFNFNRTLYTNSDYKGRPTIAVSTPSEKINDEEYSKLILPAQVINDFTLSITERDGSGLDANRNLIITMEIEELDLAETTFHESKRQHY